MNKRYVVAAELIEDLYLAKLNFNHFLPQLT